jgi:hypothetical protein
MMEAAHQGRALRAWRVLEAHPAMLEIYAAGFKASLATNRADRLSEDQNQLLQEIARQERRVLD